jgi:uncharacterized membrane protein
MISYFTNLTWPKLAKITWLLIGFFIALTFSFCLFKYYTYSYNCLDLAIYNQVFFNSANGQLFNFTIHPTSYLGDHFEIIILFLIPFYSLFKSPLTLLLIQSCFLGFSAIPFYLIAKKHLTPLLGFLVICLYLFNATTLNIALFEFHILPLVIFFVLWAFYFYDQNKFWPFLAFCGISLLIREDVAFIIFMFGIIALLDRKKFKWIITPILLATGYFFVALKISAYFSGSQNYKFLFFYSWLGNSVQEIFINFFLKFPEVLNHIFSNITHLELILGLLVIMLFIPLYRPKYLLLGVPSLLEFLLGPNSGSLVIQSHYISLFLPGLLIAAIFSLKNLRLNPKIINLHSEHKEIIPSIIIISLVYILWQLGPLANFFTVPLTTDYHQVTLKNQFSQLIPENASLLTGFDLLPNFSSRSQVYFLRYAYLGRQQFNAGDYKLPEDLQYIFLNFDDFLYLDSYSQSKTYSTDYFQADDRLRDLLAQNYSLIKVEDNLALWQKKGPKTDLALYNVLDKKIPEIKNKKSQTFDSKIEFLGYDQKDKIISLYFKCLEAMDKNYFLNINDHYYPLGYGLYPTSNWQPGEIIKINLFNLEKFNSFQISHPHGGLQIGPLNSFQEIFNQIEILGKASLN